VAGVNPFRPELHTLTLNLVFRDCATAIAFYARAFGAVETSRVPSPDGARIWHAELRIGDSTFFVNDEMPGMGLPAPTPASPAPVTMWLAAPDCDAAFQRAVAAGAKPTMPPADMFWGDRCAEVADPFGYAWSFATHTRDLTPEEIRKGAEEAARMFEQQTSKPS
jgi:PhnB protein